MIRLCQISICLLIVLSGHLYAVQSAYPPKAARIVDSALSIMDMSRKDCAMRSDLVSPDNHRLSLTRNLFANPFGAFDISEVYTRHLRHMSIDNADVFFNRLLTDIQLGPFKSVDFDAQTQDTTWMQNCTLANGSPLTSVYFESLTMSTLLRQYIRPVILAAKATQLARADLLKHSMVLRECDSLLMMSEDDANANPYELKRAAQQADSISRLFFEEASYCDLSSLLSTSLSLYRDLLTHARDSRTALGLLKDSVRNLVIQTPYGRIAIGGAGDDTYSGEYLFVLDVGGDDHYFLQATKNACIKQGLHVIVDLSGDDVYLGSSYTLGAGVLGGGILIDMAGNDLYKAGSFSMGAGLFGVGILHDAGGTDSYSGAVFSEGAGAFGVGLLLDEAGNDSYTVQANGQAFGFSRGCGLLVDYTGNDVYTTASPFVDILRYDSHFVSFTQGAALGQRPIASGGIGILYDASGNDTYTCDIYGQGSAYWFGFAALIDEAGEDRYQAYQYAQGAGIHFAHGLLWDKAGDDVYVSHGVSQGCGHDVGFGMLLDETGNDSYTAESLSLGGGNANAVSILADVEGDDAYIARSPSSCFGFSDFRRNYGMIGIFADGGGNDTYGSATRNNSVRLQSTYGVFLDENFSSLEKTPSAQPSAAPEKPKLVLSSTLDSLFIQASTAPQKYQFMVQPAREKIIATPDSALRFLSRFLGTPDPRERLAMEYLIPKLYERDSTSVVNLLRDSLRASSIGTVNFCLWEIGKSHITTLGPEMSSLVKHDDWRVRAMLAQQIGEAGLVSGVKDCITLLKDSVPMVRMRAAYSVAQLQPERVGELLKVPLKDNLQIVRNSVGQGLRAHKNLAPELWANIFNTFASARAQRSLVFALTAIDTNLDNAALVDALKKADPEVRESAYRLIADLSQDYWKRCRQVLRDQESEAELQKILGDATTIQAQPLRDIEQKVTDEKSDQPKKKAKKQKQKPAAATADKP